MSRKKDLYGRVGAVFQFGPCERDGFVVAGETSTRLAALNTDCSDWATEEFIGPTTPTTPESATRAVAFCSPMLAVASSSFATSWNVTPGTSCSLLAMFTASCAEYLRPWPGCCREPVSGESTPICTTVS